MTAVGVPLAVDQRPSTGHAGCSPATVPSLLGLVAGFVAVYLEVEAGDRPRRHLRDLMVSDAYLRIGSRVPGTARPRAVVRLRGRLTTSDRFDAVVLLRDGERVGALAVGLRRTPTGWRVADVARPEDRFRW